MRRKVKGHLSRENLAAFAAGMIDILAELPRDLQEFRYQALNTFRRSDHLYMHSMSKLSYVGKMLIEYVMAGLAVAVGALAYFCATAGAAAADAWLAERLPLPAPWWVCVLVLLHVITRLQRIRVRFTDID